MSELNSIGKVLILLAGVLAALGVIFLLAGKIPWLGRLPGDIFVQRKNFSFFFPITTSILLSLILSLIFYLFSRR